MADQPVLCIIEKLCTVLMIISVRFFVQLNEHWILFGIACHIKLRIGQCIILSHRLYSSFPHLALSPWFIWISDFLSAHLILEQRSITIEEQGVHVLSRMVGIAKLFAFLL